MTAMARQLEEAQDVNPWASPDMSILSAGRSTPPPLPAEIFGEIWPLVSDLADGAGAPVDYAGISLLAICASLIGGKRRVRPFPTSTWEEPCILWTANVGDPSSNKSPALDPQTAILRDLETEYVDQHKRALQMYETRKERASAERKVWAKQVEEATKAHMETPVLPDDAVEPERPQRRRLLVQDGTPEAVAEILAANPMGTFHLRDELAGWFQSFDRYSPGGREFWLEAYGGRVFTIDRKSNPVPLRIPFNGVSVVGGIQPEKLRDMFETSPDDGLVARFIWAWPDPIPYHRPRQKADEARLRRMLQSLDGLHFARDLSGNQQPVVLPLSDGAADIFEAWVRENSSAVADASALFKSFMGKGRGTVLRLALTAELMAWADRGGLEPNEVSAASVVASINFFESYAAPTALRVFGDAALPPVERDAAALARYIQRQRLKKVNARTIRRESKIPNLRQAQAVDDAIEHLVEAEWLKPAPSRSGDAAGRQKKDYLVNPAVLQGQP